MTLRELFDYLSVNPQMVVAYFLLMPAVALLAGYIAKGDGHLNPWKYLYAVMVFLVCIPGIFAATLAVYLFLFESGGSIYNVNLLTQVLPIGSMIATLSIIRRNVAYEQIPGFGKLSDLIMMIASIIVLMYFLDKMHLVAWIYVPVQWLFIIVIGFLLLFRFGLKRMMA